MYKIVAQVVGMYNNVIPLRIETKVSMVITKPENITKEECERFENDFTRYLVQAGYNLKEDEKIEVFLEEGDFDENEEVEDGKETDF